MTDPVAANPAGAARRSSRLWFIALLVLALAASALLLLRPGSQASADDVLVIGDQRGGAQALLTASGELKGAPYRIKWALFPAAAPLLEALDAGAIDIGGIGGAPFAFAYASGAHIRAVTAYRPAGARAGKASAIVVPKDSRIRTLADLRGKRVATIRGSAGQDLVLRLLERAKIDPKRIRWTYLSNGEAKAALATGAVDAWSTWGSYVGIAVLEDGDRIIADGGDLPTGVGFYAANDKAISTKRAILKTTEAGGPRGYDAGKKIIGRKRHAMVDTDGRALELLVHSADIQDRDGAVPLLKQSRQRHPFVERTYADSAYNSDRVRDATSITIEIIRKFADQTGFVVHPRRWVVERTFAWLNRNRRLAKDFERTIKSATALLYAAAASVLIRRIARYA